MSKELIILLSVSLIIIIIIIISIYMFISKSKNDRHKRLYTLQKDVELINLELLVNILGRAQIISNNTKNYQEDIKELNIIFSKLELEKNFLNNFIQQKIASFTDYSFKEYKKIINTIKNKLKDLTAKRKLFLSISDNVIQKSENLVDHLNNLSSINRKVIDEYKKFIPVFKKIKIDWYFEDLIQKNKELFNNINEIFQRSEYIKVVKLTIEYKANIEKLVLALDESPLIYHYIHYDITGKIKKLVQSYLKLEKEKVNLKYLNLNDAFLSLSIEQKKLIELFKSANLKESKNHIIIVEKKIAYIKSLINLEKYSMSFIKRNKTSINNIFDRVILDYGNYIRNITEANLKGFKVDEKLRKMLKTTKSLIKELSGQRDILKEMDRPKIPYSILLQKVKKILIIIKNIKVEMNNGLIQMWNHNSQEIIGKNKLNKSQSALNAILLLIKEKNIFLDKKEKQIINIANETIFNIEKLSFKQKGFLDKVTELEKYVSDIYKVIGIKVTIVEIINNLFLELNKERVLNETVNNIMKKAEGLFMEGAYSKSLNVIITVMEKRG